MIEGAICASSDQRAVGRRSATQVVTPSAADSGFPVRCPQAFQASVQSQVLGQVPLQGAYDRHGIVDDAVTEELLVTESVVEHVAGALGDPDGDGEGGVDLFAAYGGVVVVRALAVGRTRGIRKSGVELPVQGDDRREVPEETA